MNKKLLKKILWKFLASLALCHLGTQLSFWSFVANGSSLFYATLPIAIILIYWWGPIVLLSVFINATLSASLWNLGIPMAYPIYALPETIFVYLSWLFFIKLRKGKCWLPNIKELTFFLIVGLVVPLIIQSFLLRSIFLVFKQIEASKFWPLFISTTLGDFIMIFGLTTPVLYFATSRMQSNGITIIEQTIPRSWPKVSRKIKKGRNSIELGIIVLLITLINNTLAFTDFWFLYGILSLYSAIRYGFGISILVNSYILLLTYVLPAIFEDQFRQDMILSGEMSMIQIGSSLLYVFSLVTGRIMSDGRAFQRRINRQNKELEHINKELDRFVYSVSHDLSAPLKSIRGLVNISRVEEMNDRLKDYINHIEISTDKLETFISEILDFSRNDRMPVKNEYVDLKELCIDILDGIRFLEHFGNVNIDTQGIDGKHIYSDKLRLKIILTNLLSNAIKYQKPQKKGNVSISMDKTAVRSIILVKDDGEGIRTEFKKKIFEMFYRATTSSNGSGLGLYISQEVVEKLGGSISVDSELGVGSTFKVTIPAD